MRRCNGARCLRTFSKSLHDARARNLTCRGTQARVPQAGQGVSFTVLADSGKDGCCLPMGGAKLLAIRADAGVALRTLRTRASTPAHRRRGFDLAHQVASYPGERPRLDVAGLPL